MPRRVYPNLRAFFEANPDVSGESLARELGISFSYMSMIKWGQREPRLPLALKIQDRCNVPLESLIHKRHGLARVG